MSVRRPEHKAPPEIYYDENEAKKYTQNSRVIEVQEKCTERALELLALPEDESCFLLDLGCGSGLSGELLTDHGHIWMGVDISSAMLDVAVEREVEGNLVLGDLGQGLPLRAGLFEGVVSISAIQWLCNADKASHNPSKRLYKLFMTLYGCMARGSRAVFQFYPENDAQAELIISQAMRAGFTGGLVVDYPNSSKAKKVFLVLNCGGFSALPQSLGDEDNQRSQAMYNRREKIKSLKGKAPKKEWIKMKKERRRKQGKEVRSDSKFSGRRRAGKFE